MQLALNVVVFFLGFSLAIFASLRPKKARASLEASVRNVQYVLDALKIRPREKQSDTLHTAEAGHGADHLLTVSQVEEKYSAGQWQRVVFDQIKASILGEGPENKTFPCVYAAKGLRDNQHRYVFLHSDDPSQPRNLRVIGEALRTYIALSRSLGRNTSIILVCPPSEQKRSLEYYQQNFWNTLRGLRVYDSKPWPKDIPEDVDDSKWAFCFDGSPIFPVALTPLHEKRHSRWAPSFCIALQPKWVFDILLSTDAKREGATNKVRALLKEYDEIAPSPSLTPYGQTGTTEAHQLFLFDSQEEAQCPFEDFDR